MKYILYLYYKYIKQSVFSPWMRWSFTKKERIEILRNGWKNNE